RLRLRLPAGRHRPHQVHGAGAGGLDHHDRPRLPRRRRADVLDRRPPRGPAPHAAGRAIVGSLSPPARTAEFFGLWGLAVKAASIFGPLTYGIVTWLFEGHHRLAILAVGAYFVCGLALLAG